MTESKTPPFILPIGDSLREAIIIADLLLTAHTRLSMFGKSTALLVLKELRKEKKDPGIIELRAMVKKVVESYDE